MSEIISNPLILLQNTMNMCNKYDNYHSKLFDNHQAINLENNNEDIFTRFIRRKRITIINLNFL